MTPINNYRGQQITWPRVLEVLEDYLDGRREYSYDTDTESCRYRLDETAECDVACLIGSFLSDDKYEPKTLEKKGITDIINRNLLPINSQIESRDLQNLQGIHDCLAVGDYDILDFLEKLSVPTKYQDQLKQIRSKITSKAFSFRKSLNIAEL